MILLITVAILTILFSFLCSIWEAVLLSATPTFLESKIQEGKAYAVRLKEMKENIDRPLAAILTLNTIAHTVGAMWVGGIAETNFHDTLPINLGFVEISVVSIIASVMTLAILLLSEIIPKTLGATYWKRLSHFTEVSLRIILVILRPFVWISQLITKALKQEDGKSVLSRADFSAMARLGIEEGIFAKQESDILANLLDFDKVLVKSIMTPRMVVKAAPEDMTIGEFYESNPELRFSRIPLYNNSIDEVTGFILKDRLLEKMIDEASEQPLSSIKRKITIFHENTPITTAFKQMMKERQHISLVVDEFGGTEGIVTIEDIMETLLGLEIVDEFDNVEDLQLMARRNWERRAQRLGLLEEEAKENKEENK